MSNIIKDGTGEGFTAKVNSENRLFVNAIQISDTSAKAQEGDAYLVSTVINLTSTGESGLFYIKNNEPRDVILTSLGVVVSLATGSAAGSTSSVRLIKDPTGGTLISAANNAPIANRNLGSSNTLTANIYEGVQGSTVTGGTDIFVGFLGHPSGFAQTSSLVLPKGSALALAITPPADTTALSIGIGVTAHLDGFSN